VIRGLTPNNSHHCWNISGTYRIMTARQAAGREPAGMNPYWRIIPLMVISRTIAEEIIMQHPLVQE